MNSQLSEKMVDEESLTESKRQMEKRGRKTSIKHNRQSLPGDTSRISAKLHRQGKQNLEVEETQAQEEEGRQTQELRK